MLENLRNDTRCLEYLINCYWLPIGNFVPVVEGVSNDRLKRVVDRNLVGVIAHSERLEERILLFNIDNSFISLLLVHWLPSNSKTKVQHRLLNVIVGGAGAHVRLAIFSFDVVIQLLGGHLDREEVSLLKRVEENRG